MQLTRCPLCHARISLDALVQDEAGRELMKLVVGLDTETATHAVAYIGLFRSASRDLANHKALVLLKEVLVLSPSNVALRITVDNLRDKASKPLTNHNYLKSVMATQSQQQSHALSVVSSDKHRARTAPPSNTAMALQALEDWAND